MALLQCRVRLSSMLQNEAKTLQAFQADPYGCHGDLWQRRRHAIHLPWGHTMGIAALA